MVNIVINLEKEVEEKIEQAKAKLGAEGQSVLRIKLANFIILEEEYIQTMRAFIKDLDTINTPKKEETTEKPSNDIQEINV